MEGVNEYGHAPEYHVHSGEGDFLFFIRSPYWS